MLSNLIGLHKNFMKFGGLSTIQHLAHRLQRRIVFIVHPQTTDLPFFMVPDHVSPGFSFI